MSKPDGLPDYPTDKPLVRGHMHANGPRMHDYLKVICDTIRERPGTVIFGEMYMIPIEQMDLSIAPHRGEMDMTILFEHVFIDQNDDGVQGRYSVKPFDLHNLKTAFHLWYSNIKEGWISLYWCNHDQPRIVSRWGDEGEFWEVSAKALGMTISFMRGTPFIYQGEELGMTGWKFNYDQANDLEFFGFYKKLVTDLKLQTHDQFMEASHKIARDTARTPVHWTAGENAGFTRGKPWIGMCGNHEKINAEAQTKDPHSIFSFYKKIIKTRKSESLAIYGEIRFILDSDDDLLGYERFDSKSENSAEKLVFLANFSRHSKTLKTKEIDPSAKYEVVLCNYDDYSFNAENIEIRPWLAVLLRCTKA